MNPMRNAAMTIRCHIQRTIKPQTVAEHSFHVAMMAWKLCDREPSADLLKACLFHDLAESYTGDIPANVKWDSPMIKEELERLEGEFEKANNLYVSLTPNEQIVLKWADSLELMWHCVDEMYMGNRFVDKMYHAIAGFLQKMIDEGKVLKNCIQEFNKVKEAYAIANTR